MGRQSRFQPRMPVHFFILALITYLLLRGKDPRVQATRRIDDYWSGSLERITQIGTSFM